VRSLAVKTIDKMQIAQYHYTGSYEYEYINIRNSLYNDIVLSASCL